MHHNGAEYLTLPEFAVSNFFVIKKHCLFCQESICLSSKTISVVPMTIYESIKHQQCISSQQ